MMMFLLECVGLILCHLLGAYLLLLAVTGAFAGDAVKEWEDACRKAQEEFDKAGRSMMPSKSGIGLDDWGLDGKTSRVFPDTSDLHIKEYPL